MTKTITYKYLHFIKYAIIDRWDVKTYQFKQKQFEDGVLLRNILIPYHVTISKKELIKNGWKVIAKINFAGELYLHDTDRISNIKGNTFFKIDGDTLIYSKINVRHGCVYYHPSDAVPFGVSSEYPAYKFDKTRIFGDYLVLILRSNYFKQNLAAMTSGIAKARTKPEDFLNIEIPLPSLEEQHKIVTAYNYALAQAKKLKEQAQSIDEQIKNYWHEILGVASNQNEEVQNSKYEYLNFTNFFNLSEWGIEIIQNNKKREIFKYPMAKIKTLCQLGSGGTPSRSCPQYYKGTIPWVKTGEVINDEIIETEEHITAEAITNSSAKLYPKGSLIIAMYGQGDTRGRTAKLGINAATNQACAVLYNINNSIVTTDYLWYYLQWRYYDLRSMASGNNQPNLNAGKINNYDIVIPPIDIQDEMVNHTSILRDKIQTLKNDAIKLRQQAIINFETTIFA